MNLALSFRSLFAVASPVAVASLFAVASVAACSSGTSGTGSSGTSGGSTPASAADCASRCEAKFTKCGGTAASGKSGCSAQVCNASPTAEQLTCLENKTCEEISASSGFASLCPAGTATPAPTGTAAGATCGTATCAAGEYCSLSYDTSAEAWTPSGCKKVPAACTSSSLSELCTTSCMQENSGCPTTGSVLTKCSLDNGALAFGCR